MAESAEPGVERATFGVASAARTHYTPPDDRQLAPK